VSFLIGGVTYTTVKVGRGRRLHLARGAGTYSMTYCGWPIDRTTEVIEHSGEHDLLCNACDAYARAARAGRTL
jgi:hypothetical protein